MDAATESRIADTARRAGFVLDRIVNVRGETAAVFSLDFGRSIKSWTTRFYSNESQFVREVLDTLDTITINMEVCDVNIFSSDMFEYLCAEMLPTDGRPVSLTIANVIQDTVAGPRGESNKVIMTFVERPKKLILNKTNARVLARSLGNETNDWRGAVVTLGVEDVKVGRNTVPSIRIKSATPKATAKPATKPEAAHTDPEPVLFDTPQAGNGAYEE